MHPFRFARFRPMRSIRTRVALSHLAVIAVAMLLSGFALLSSIDRYFTQAMERNLVAQAQITAQTLIPGSVAIGPLMPGSVGLGPLSDAAAAASNTIRQQRVDNLYLQAENAADPALGFAPPLPLGELDLGYLTDTSLELGAALDTRIRVLDAAGIVLVDSAGADQGADLSSDPLVAEALQGRYARHTAGDGHAAAMHIAVPVIVEGKLGGVVYLSQPLRDVAAVLRDLRLRWALSMAVALPLAGLAGLLFSRAIARPVRQLTAAASAVAEGQLDRQVPVRSRDEIGRLSAAFNDMTARLCAARQTQVDFVANVSHELRTPLTSLKGLVETLRDGAVDDVRVRDRFLETIEGETDRLIGLVNDLLLLSRVDSDALTVHRQPVDLVELAASVIDQFAFQGEAQDLTLRVDTPPGLPAAWADPSRTTQVLLNLLDNAVKYSPSGSTIVVGIDSPDSDLGGPDPEIGGLHSEIRDPDPATCYLRVAVRDEGPGIPADLLPRLGERFFRVDKARARPQGGVGLGLAIARALVEAQGGRLWLESIEGHGTTATFTLPTAN
jgi:signal transduction histidine kinase